MHFLPCDSKFELKKVITVVSAKKGPWAVHITLCSDKGVGGYL